MSVEETVVIDQQNHFKLRAGKLIMIAIGLGLVGAISTTYAFLTYSGNQVPNRFTVSEMMTCDMLEPAWTNAALTDNGVSDLSNPTITDATKVKYYDTAEKKAVPEASQLQVPGTYYAKNPFVVNTSTNASDPNRDTNEKHEDRGFAGLKVQFQKVSADGEYVNMTQDDVKALLACYYIGSKNTTANSNEETPATETTSSTKAGFGNGSSSDANSSVLGNNWYQLIDNGTSIYGTTNKGESNSDGVMYFVNNKRLDSLAKARTTSETTTEVDDGNGGKTTQTSTTIHDFVEDPTSATWGYSVTGENVTGTDYCYATTPLFQTVRYVDGATKTQMQALRDVLDPLGGTDGKTRTVTNAGYIPSWRMVISSGIIQAESATDTVLDGSGNLKTDSVWFTNFKTVLDASAGTSGTTAEKDGKPTTSTGVRVSSKLGAYITKTDDGATITGGTGVPEPTDIPTTSTD